jgi:hypothetical protein
MRWLHATESKSGSGENQPGQWIKSSLSTFNGNCVEVAGLAEDAIRVRHSKNPKGEILKFTPAEWDAFIGGVRNGEFDRISRTRR